MRKNIITSAMVLGTLGSQASNFSFAEKNVTLELSGGRTIEIILQQEMPDEDLNLNLFDAQNRLSREVINNEQMLQILNKIRYEEQEINEEMNF